MNARTPPERRPQLNAKLILAVDQAVDEAQGEQLSLDEEADERSWHDWFLELPHFPAERRRAA